MAKLTLTDITSGYALTTTVNANNALIEAALENTLSRDGTGPNTMSAALDMNSQNINNLPNATQNQQPVTLAQAASIAGVTNALTRETVGAVFYPATTTETAAAITPTNYYHAPGDIRRYGAVMDGATDDQAAVQAAVNSGHVVWIPNGSVRLESVVTLASNVEIRADRNATITQATSGTACLQGTDLNDVVIDGGRWVGASTSAAIDSGNGGLIYINNDGTSTGNVKITNTEITTAVCGISCISVSGLWIQNNDISNTGTYCVLASRCKDFHIDHNYLHDTAETGAANTYAVSATGDEAGGDIQARCSISFNHCKNFASWSAIMTHDVTKLICTGNIIENVRTGFDITSASSANVLQDIIISNNIIELTSTDNWAAAGAFSAGIGLQGNATNKLDRVVVTGNVIKNWGNITGATISGTPGPIAFLYCRYITCTGNSIEGVGTVGVSGVGIYVVQDSEVVSITGNVMDGTMDAGGIRFASVTANAVSIVGNSIIQDTNSDLGIYITGSTITHLVCDHNATDSTTAFSTATTTITDYSGAAINESFTGTLTGCTTSPTGTIDASVSGDIVTLEIPTITGTSNTTAATITGMPATLYPAALQSCVGLTQDNSTSDIGRIVVNTNGVITLYNGVSTTFTGSGTKGVDTCVITYRLR